MKLTKGAITAEALPQVRERLLQADSIDQIDLPGLSGERRPIIAGGVLVLEAAFQALGLQKLLVSKAAMREGILYDMLGRGGVADPRDASIDALTRRYGIDEIQAARVEGTALRRVDCSRRSGRASKAVFGTPRRWVRTSAASTCCSWREKPAMSECSSR